jgi:hypothetical protein
MLLRTNTGRARILSIGILAAVLPTLTYGQLPVSRPAAVLPIAVAGAATTAIGVPFLRESALRDVVSGVAGQDITGSTTYTAGAFANTHMVLVMTGTGRGTGLPITANNATTLTVTGTIPALVSNSDEFEIVPLNTLSTLFGAPPINLAGGANAAAADKVIVNGIRYFYKSSAPSGWRLETAPFGADQGNVTIGNLSGVNVVRIGGATNVNVRGVNRSTRAVIPIANGTTLVSWPYPGVVTLAGSGLSSTLTGGANAAAADKVIIGGIRYFFKTSAPSGWRLETAPFGADQGGVALNPGDKAFNIIRLGGATGHPVRESFVP